MIVQTVTMDRRVPVSHMPFGFAINATWVFWSIALITLITILIVLLQLRQIIDPAKAFTFSIILNGLTLLLWYCEGYVFAIMIVTVYVVFWFGFMFIALGPVQKNSTR